MSRSFLLGPWLLKVVELIVCKGPEAPRIKKLRLPDKWDVIPAEVIRRLLNPPSGDEREDYRPRFVSAVTDWLVDSSQYVPFVKLILDVTGAVRQHYRDDANALATTDSSDSEIAAQHGSYNPLAQIELQEYENAKLARRDRERNGCEVFYKRVTALGESLPLRSKQVLYYLLLNALRKSLELDVPERSHRDIAVIVGGGSRTRALVSTLAAQLQQLKAESVPDDLAELTAIKEQIEKTTDESVREALRAPLEVRRQPETEESPGNNCTTVTAPKVESSRDDRGLAGIDRSIERYQHDTSWYTKPSFAAGAAAEQQRCEQAKEWIEAQKADARRQAAAELIAFQLLNPEQQLQMIASKMAEAQERSRTLTLNREAQASFKEKAARDKVRHAAMGKLAEQFHRSVEVVKDALEALEGPALAAGVDLDRFCFGNLLAQQTPPAPEPSD